jgi:hypothetical protein
MNKKATTHASTASIIASNIGKGRVLTLTSSRELPHSMAVATTHGLRAGGVWTSPSNVLQPHLQ